MKRIPASLFKWVLQLVQPSGLGSSAGFKLPPPLVWRGSKAASPDQGAAAIPKILWTYWNQAQPDAFVRQCIQSWQRQCPDHEIRLVHPGNLQQYMASGDLPAQFAALHPTKQSDWLRLYLVARHGGFWFDATTLLTDSLEWMRRQAGPGVEFAGFYLEGFTRDPQFPVVESWAFGAPAGAAFVSAWQQEFHRALIEEGTQAYIARLQGLPGWGELLQGIPDPEYLLIHLAAQQVLRRENAFGLALNKAEDTAFYYHKALRWKWYLLYPRLCLAPAPEAAAPLVKLRGGERRHFSAMLEQHGGAAPASLWQRALGPQAPAQ